MPETLVRASCIRFLVVARKGQCLQHFHQQYRQPPFKNDIVLVNTLVSLPER